MSSAEPKRVVITGISSRLGRLVAQRLHRLSGYRVVGLDRRPFADRPKDIELHQVDVRSKKARDIFRGGRVDALVHMGVMHKPRAKAAELYSFNVSGTAKLFEYCQAYEVPKVVVLSSATLYGARPDNAQFLGEDTPLLFAQTMPQMRYLVEIDHLASSFFWKARDIETVLLRPVHILGRVRNAPSNYLRLDRPPTLLGFDPMVQLVHELDVVEAIACALRPGARGVYNITGPGELPLSAVLRELGRPSIPFPHPIAQSLLGRLWQTGLTSFPVPELDFIRYVCMVDGSRAASELGYRPRHTLKETIRAVLADREPSR